MSLPDPSSLHATHSRSGSCGGHHSVGLVSSIGMHHFPCLEQHSAGYAHRYMLHVASGATTRQGRGGGAVSPLAYTTPARSLMFSLFVATSQDTMEHSVSSLSQSQSSSAAKRKNATKADKDTATKKRRGKLDTKDDNKHNNEEDVSSHQCSFWREAVGTQEVGCI